MLVLSCMVCVWCATFGYSSEKEGGSVGERDHEIPVLAIQRLDWRVIITSLGRVVGVGGNSECILPSPVSNWEYRTAFLPAAHGVGDHLLFSSHLKRTGFLVTFHSFGFLC